ncbi:MAG: hypothetical protein ACKVXR_13940 [Planctomycetota bacterium]
MKPFQPARHRAGATFIELAIGVSLLLLLVGTLSETLQGLKRGSVQAQIDTQFQAQGQHALRTIVDDLKRSGFATVGGEDFPHLFLDGNAQGAFAGHAHAPAVHTAVAGDPDFGPNREMVFLQPADLDNDERPDLDGAGRLVWSADQFSYVLVTRNDGTNVLERRVNGGAARKIVRDVERITFDDNTTSVGAVPLRAIRVRIWFRKLDERGAPHRLFVEAVVNLRNG